MGNSIVDVFKSISSQIKQFQFLFILIINAIVVGCFVYFFPIRFEENDDVVMLLISSGGYTGTPDAHLIFINYLYGLLLKFLYLSFPSIEWYTILFLLLHIASLSIVFLSILKKQCDGYLKILMIILFYAFELTILINLQFTTTAALTSFAGIVLLREKNSYSLLFGTLFFIVGSLIRYEAALLVLLISAPMFLQEIFEEKIILSKQINFLLVAIALGMFMKGINHLAYSFDIQWNTYKEYNELRGKINDNPNAQKIIESLPKEIKINDYKLLLRFIPDYNILNIEKLLVVNDKLKRQSFFEKLQNIKPALYYYKEFLFLITLIVISLLLYSCHVSGKVIISLCFTLFIVALCYVSLDGSLKFRVFLTAALPVLFLPVEFAPVIKYRNMRFPPHIFVYIILLSLFLFLLVYKISISNEIGYQMFIKQHSFISRYLADPRKSVVPYRSNYSIENQNPLFVTRSHFKGQMFFSGWLTGSPLNEKVFNSYKNFIEGLGLFMNKPSQEVIPLIIKSIEENYGIHVKSKVILDSTAFQIVEFFPEDYADY